MVNKRILLIVIVVSIFLPFILTVKVFAQADNIQRKTKIDFDNSYKEYITKLEEYKKAHPLYVAAKAQYLRSKTQKSQSELMDAGIAVLKLRDEVIMYHMDMIMKKYKDTDGATDETEKILQTKVDEEVKWYEKHILSLPTASDLEDLSEDSGEAETRKKSQTDKIVYEIILNVAYASTQDYSDRFKDLLTQFTQKFDIIRADTREGFAFDAKKVALIDKYINEMEILIERSDDKRGEIYSEIVKSRVLNESQYNLVIKSLMESTQHQKDATFKLIETIAEIKVQDIE